MPPAEIPSTEQRQVIASSVKLSAVKKPSNL